MKDAIKKIGIHTLAVYVAMVASVILTIVLILIIPGAGRAASPVGKVLDAPFWVPQLTCGAALGWFVRRRLSLTNEGYGIILPAVLLGMDILKEGLPMRKWTPLVDIYFSANNGDTEGIYKLIFVAPVYVAAAYALGALASTLAKTKTHDSKPEAGATSA